MSIVVIKNRLQMRNLGILCGSLFASAASLSAQVSPWGTAAQKLATEFAGPIVKGLAVVAIVLGGLSIAFGQGGESRRVIGGLLFGLSMSLAAASFITWLFT